MTRALEYLRSCQNMRGSGPSLSPLNSNYYSTLISQGIPNHSSVEKQVTRDDLIQQVTSNNCHD